VAHDEARLEPSGPKAKPATSKPKHPAVAAADAHPAKPRSPPANTETAIASLRREIGCMVTLMLALLFLASYASRNVHQPKFKEIGAAGSGQEKCR
jgi:hypothetical protein